MNQSERMMALGALLATLTEARSAASALGLGIEAADLQQLVEQIHVKARKEAAEIEERNRAERNLMISPPPRRDDERDMWEGGQERMLRLQREYNLRRSRHILGKAVDFTDILP